LTACLQSLVSVHSFFAFWIVPAGLSPGKKTAPYDWQKNAVPIYKVFRNTQPRAEPQTYQHLSGRTYHQAAGWLFQHFTINWW